ncbi:type III secretion protein [Xylophilus rhododendri]|uniref:Type III secretion protein n=1 Tax=Xylophilus rhododendri TaxID=2697032 RepID=A0A857J5R9_9BURK|nr:flagellar biosynthetic protein FliR [Xylophilus rhododendri]QHI99176.1 type III secretion protein [Xylophilus rhododendri]
MNTLAAGAQEWLHGLQPVLLASARLGSALLLTPIFASSGIPATARVFFILGLAACLVGGTAPSLAASQATPAAVLQELAFGATLALGIHLAFASFALAGRLLDVQIGYGLAQVLDPLSNTSQPVLSAAFTQLGVVCFFLSDAHHALLRGFGASLQQFPLGAPWPLAGAAPTVLRQVGAMATLGFAMAAPVVVCILLVEFALGVLARSLPGMNLIALGIAAKIVVGLGALSLWIAVGGATVRAVYAALFSAWSQWFATGGSALR